MLTKTLRNGVTVTARLYEGEPYAITYANRTQAQRAADKLGEGWAVYQFGRPFFVAQVARTAFYAAQAPSEGRATL